MENVGNNIPTKQHTYTYRTIRLRLLITAENEIKCRAGQRQTFSSLCASEVGCPNFASKTVLLQSETKRNANGFAKLWKKNILLHFAFFASKVSLCFVKKYVLLQSFASGTVSLQIFCIIQIFAIL